MGKFTPSKYQLAIYKEYNTTKNNLFISAGPGSGKTTTIIELVKQKPLSRKAIMLAFNNSIQKELEKRVPAGVDTSTLHSLGFRLLRKHLSCPIKVNNLKSFIFGKKLFHEFLDRKYKNNEKNKNIHLFILSRLVDLRRMNLAEANANEIYTLSEDFNVGAGPVEIQQAVELSLYIDNYNKLTVRDGKELMIDFTDMIYLALKMVPVEEYPRYQEVFIDEIQDLNKLQKKLVDNLIGRKGRFIAVGDERQAIYGFTGSNLDQLNEFKNSKNTTVLPLSVSYRCSKKIVEEANKIFPGLEYAEGAEEGIVRNGTLQDIQPNDFVICRNNLPLVSNFIDMLGSERKAVIVGKDFGKSLSTLLSKVEKIEDLDTLLKEKKEEVKEKGHPAPENSQPFQTLLEKTLIIRTLYNKYGDLGKLRTVIDSMFKDVEDISKDSILLMTAHKSKGLEADRVVWIEPALFPSKYAVTQKEMYSEMCLQYVLTTRARKELIIVRPTLEELTSI